MEQDVFVGPVTVGTFPSDALSPGAELPYFLCTVWQGNDYRDTTQGKIQHETAFTKQLLDNKAIKDERCNWQPLFHVLQGDSRGNSDKLSSPAFLHQSVILALCSKRSHKDGCLFTCTTLLLSCCLTLSYLIATSWIYHNPLVDVKEKQAVV